MKKGAQSFFERKADLKNSVHKENKLCIPRTKKAASFFGPRRKQLRAQNRVLRCAQPGPLRLVRKTGPF